MEKAKIESREALLQTLVEVSPATLREAANLLELASARVSSTETVMVRFTERITLLYKPSQKMVEQIREKGNKPSTEVVPLKTEVS